MRHYHTLTDLRYGEHPGQHLELIIPAQAEDQTLVALVAAIWGEAADTTTLRALAWRLAESGRPVAIIAHRQLGKAFATDGSALLDDLLTGLRLAVDEASLYGVALQAPILIGEGGGALLALLAAQRLHSDVELYPQAVIAVSPPPGLAGWDGCPPELTQALRRFAGPHGERLDPGRIDGQRLPPTLVLHPEDSPLLPAAALRAYCDGLRQSGAEIELHLLPGAELSLHQLPAATPAAAEPLLAWLSKPAGD